MGIFKKIDFRANFWDYILPKLCEFEKMTWGSILLDGKKVSSPYYCERF